MGFWNFPASAKWDELDEERHQHLIEGALKDTETGVEEVDRKTFLLYGSEEALLFRPTSTALFIGISLYEAMLSMFSRS